MIQIKHIASNTAVTPMPSGQGRFGDVTLPDCLTGCDWTAEVV